MTDTHCPYCALQCGMQLVPSASGWQVAPRDFPTNKGGLCRKGWTAAALLDSPTRLTTPLLRTSKGGPLLPASWDVALERIVQAIGTTRERYGADAVGVFGGGGLTNEKAYLLGKFARVALHTSRIDYNGRFCMSSAAAASIRAFGIDRGLPFPLDDISHAGAILLMGSNAAETMPPVMQFFDAQRERGGSLIVADPRQTPTARTADLHLQLTPGSDGALACGILHVAIRDGLIDEPYIAARTSGFARVRQIANAYWPEYTEQITGVPARHIEQAAHMLGRATSTMILTARGTEQHSQGVDNVLACINLALALGAPGRLYSGYGCLTGQGNGQGGREHGQKADQLPGYRSLANPAHRAEIAAVWGIEADDLPAPGISAYELLSTLGQPDGVRTLLVMGSNPVVSAPHASHIRERLLALDTLIVVDPFLSETAALADVVLPSAQWAEEDGTMTNLEGRVILRRRATAPPPGVRTDSAIISALAERLGVAGFPADPAVIFDELRRATAGSTADYSGISYARIATDDGVFWPCPTPDHPGTPRLFAEHFATDDGRARFHPVRHRPPAEQPDDDYPLYLTTGRMMGHYQSGTQTRRVPELHDAAPAPFVELHPAMAATFGIVDGALVQVQTRRGSAVLRARHTSTIRHDTLFIPFHWEAAANLLTNPALDPVSRMPEFKVCAARILPLNEAAPSRV